MPHAHAMARGMRKSCYLNILLYLPNYAPDALLSSVTIYKTSCDINVPCEGAQMKNSDVALIQRVLAGDDDAFSVLVKKYQKQVHALVWRKIGDFHIAEEITQDTFLNAYKRLTTLKEPQRFASWLYVIAANRCSSWLRKKRLPIQSIEHLDQTDTEQLEKEAYSEFVVEENERISGEAQRDVVKKLLAKLGESERTVVTLHYFGEMSCAEIGAFMGVSANTVKSRLRRAQQRLQKEETVIREALDNFQITPNLTESIMHEISRIKPAAPSGSKPFVPWAVAASTLVVMLLMLGFGNHQYLTRFQKPYSLDANAEMMVEIIDAPIVANLESTPDMRKQIKSANLLVKQNDPEKQQNNDIATLSEETQTEETMKDYTQWALPEKAKARLGKGSIRAMQFSPDGNHLAVGSDIGVWLYVAETGKEISLLPGRCESLAISPDGRFLANGGGDPSSSAGGTRYETGLQLWEITTGQEVALHDALPAASVFWFSKDSKTLVTLNKSGDTICWIDSETGKSSVKKIENRLDLDPLPSAVYALTHDKVAIGDRNGILELWNSKTGEKVSTLTGPQKRNLVVSLAFSPDGTRLASGRLDKTVRLWDTTDKNEHIIFQQKQSDSPKVLVFSPDGKMFASGDNNRVRLWDAATGEPLATFTGHISKVYNLAFSPDGSVLTSASRRDGTVLYWNIKTGDQLPQNITEHTADVRALSFMNDSSTLASATSAGIITLWNLKTGHTTTHHTKTAFEYTADLAMDPLSAFSPNGFIFPSIGFQYNPDSWLERTFLIRLTDVSTGSELITKKCPIEEKWSSAFTFSPDGKTAAFGVRSYTNSYSKIRLWNIETNKIRDIQYMDHADVWIKALAFSPDGDKLVTGTSEGNVEMWDVERGVALTSFNGQISKWKPITAFSFSSNGVLLAVGNTRRIHVMASSELMLLRKIESGAVALVFVPDSSLLVSARFGGVIDLWDIETGDKLTTLGGHTATVNTLAFSPNGKTLVSSGYDGTILVWDWDEVLKGSVR